MAAGSCCCGSWT